MTPLVVLDLDALKDRLNIADNEHDAVLTEIEAEAVAFFESETDMYIRGSQDVEEEWLGPPARSLWLRDQPIDATITAISYRSQFALDWTVLASTVYTFIGRRVTFYPQLFALTDPVSATFTFPSSYLSGAPPMTPTGWPSWFAGLKIAYTRGFNNSTPSATLPSDILAALYNLCGLLFRQRVTANQGTTLFLSEPGRLLGGTPQPKLPNDIALVLANYSRSPSAGYNSGMLRVIVHE